MMMATSINYKGTPELTPAPACKVALVGFGTVGSAVARLLYARHDEHPLELTYVCNRQVARKKVDWVPEGVCWTDDIEEVIQSDADVVVELVGGVEPAHDWVRRALMSGKSVVTANKQLIAHHGAELIELARKHKQHLAFGACVAGGVPVLLGLHEGLAGDRMLKVSGILNGTCNYILTKIENTGASFAHALQEAQQAGFAEADPTEDIDGFDARAKLVILAQVGLNVHLRPDQVACRSIRPLAQIDFDYAHELGCTIRQVSRAERNAKLFYASVGPVLVAQKSPFATISGSQNLVMATGQFGGDTVFSGRGAGGSPTAVAVVSDLLHVVRYRSAGLAEPDRPAPSVYAVSRDFDTPHYVRFTVSDRPGIIAELAGIFAKFDLNIDAVLQRPGCSKSALPFVITFESCPWSRVEAALAAVSHCDFLQQPPVHMPIIR
jgi:homoserine dehydrogenase